MFSACTCRRAAHACSSLAVVLTRVGGLTRQSSPAVVLTQNHLFKIIYLRHAKVASSTGKKAGWLRRWPTRRRSSCPCSAETLQVAVVRRPLPPASPLTKRSWCLLLPQSLAVLDYFGLCNNEHQGQRPFGSPLAESVPHTSAPPPASPARPPAASTHALCLTAAVASWRRSAVRQHPHVPPPRAPPPPPALGCLHPLETNHAALNTSAQAAARPCFARLSTLRPAEVDRMWRNYTVFTVIRWVPPTAAGSWSRTRAAGAGRRATATTRVT